MIGWFLLVRNIDFPIIERALHFLMKFLLEGMVVPSIIIVGAYQMMKSFMRIPVDQPCNQSALPDTNSEFTPENRPPTQKERIVNQQFSGTMLVSGRVFVRTSTYSTWQVYRRITRPCSHTKYLQYWVPGSVAATVALSFSTSTVTATSGILCRTHGEFQWFAKHPNGYEDTEAAKWLLTQTIKTKTFAVAF